MMRYLYLLFYFIFNLRKKILLFCLGWVLHCAIAPCCAANELPDLGNPSNILTAAQEKELGESVMAQLQAALLLSQDVVVNEYLQNIGYRLVAAHAQSQPQYYFFAVRESNINAFALPGGFVGINTGLILATESEGELAGVMAHEVAHVQQKHIARMFEKMGRLRLSTLAGMLASVVLATQNPQAGSGAMAATLAGAQQTLINYTREHEKEADFVGIYILAKAGFDPMGMPAFFHRMYQETRFYTTQLPEYLQTHPLTESRLIAAQARAEAFPYKQFPDSLQYHLVRARLLVSHFQSPQESVFYFEKVLKRRNYRNRVGTLYGYALALIEAGLPEKAKPCLEELIDAYPNQPLFQLAYAQIELALQQPQKALARLSQALQNHPHHYALFYTYCQCLIKAGAFNESIRVLKQRVLQKSSEPELWNLLSTAYAQAQQPLQAHLAQAKYLKLQGDFSGAAIQIKLAEKLSKTTLEQKQVEAEKKAIEYKQNMSGRS